MKIIILTCLILMLTACEKPNSKPTYGETGLPKNCRAIVQVNIDAWRSHKNTAEEVMNSLERNCGANGYSWENK
ncbi:MULTISPECIES: kynureninase [unclassified Acinetobacter]|uniref:kynureninase n=1 Tax=unclassified Acinetobacter TaxID=196816 RepID=UPI0025C024DB|nr:MULTISPECIES: kynureninase [unclassified Acinetobacter]